VQFSIFFVNKPGVLSQIFRELGKAKINISTIVMMDSAEHGVLRMIANDPDEARAVFRQLNVSVEESGVLAVPLPNRPGAAADVCERLSAAHVAIRYMYCTGGAPGGKTIVVLKTPNLKRAMQVIGNEKAPRRDMKVKLRRPARTR